MQKQNGPGLGFARWLLPAIIFLLVIVAFLPVLQNGFAGWDDDQILLDNPNYRGLGWTQLRWMFTTLHMGHYMPLSWVTFGLDYLLWGMDPFGYHLTSLLLHAVNAVLFYVVALRLMSLALSHSHPSGELALRVAAGFAALIFAIHPLRVESVAWATERRDVLSGLFFLGTLLCYLRALAVAEGAPARRRWMAAAVIVYGLSLLSKAMGISLPIVLLVLDVYPLRRLGGGPGKWFGPAVRKVWLEKAPFLLLALAAGVIAPIAVSQIGAMQSLDRYGVAPRISQALFGLAFYLWKTVVPLGLSPLYELPSNLNLLDWPFLLSGIVVVGISVALIVARERWPAGLAIWLCYAAILAPVLGIAQNGPQITADRYTYLSCLGWAILAGAGLFCCWQAWFSGVTSLRAFVLAAALASVVVLGVLTWKQTQVWHDPERLWRYILSVTEESYFESSFAHNNLGVILGRRGEMEEAIEHYREALRINPVYVKAHNNLGNGLARRGEMGAAIEHYREALRIDPAYAVAHYNLANALVSRGELEEAVKHYREALRIDPAYVKAHNNLGNALARRGELETAVAHFQEALRFEPDFAEAHESLARALAMQGKRDEAVQHYQEALRIMRSGAGGASQR